jgi:hypothetical protein
MCKLVVVSLYITGKRGFSDWQQWVSKSRLWRKLFVGGFRCYFDRIVIRDISKFEGERESKQWRHLMPAPCRKWLDLFMDCVYSIVNLEYILVEMELLFCRAHATWDRHCVRKTIKTQIVAGVWPIKHSHSPASTVSFETSSHVKFWFVITQFMNVNFFPSSHWHICFGAHCRVLCFICLDVFTTT